MIEQKEVWLNRSSDIPDGISHPMPAIYLRYWSEDANRGPGTGRTMKSHYSQEKSSFHDHWEILYDW